MSEQNSMVTTVQLKQYGIRILESESVVRVFEGNQSAKSITSKGQRFLLTTHRLLYLSNNDVSYKTRSTVWEDVGFVQIDYIPRPVWLLILGLLTLVLVIGVVLLILYFMAGQTKLSAGMGGEISSVQIGRQRMAEAEDFIANVTTYKLGGLK